MIPNFFYKHFFLGTSKCSPIWQWMDWFMETKIGKILSRFLPMITTLWSFTDVAFDAVQAKEYYDYATVGIKNCSNHVSMVVEVLDNPNSTTLPTTLHKISMNYFRISIGTFIFPPILGITLYYVKYGRYGIFGDPNKTHFYKHKHKIESSPFIVRLTFLFLIIPTLSILRAFIGYYIFLPYFSFYFCGKLMLYGALDSKEKITFSRMEMYFTPRLLPFYTLVEQLGEAGPQIILATICLINNSHCTELYSYDVIGTSMGQLITSLFFSFGSFLIGTIKGILAGIKFWRNYRIPEHIEA